MASFTSSYRFAEDEITRQLARSTDQAHALGLLTINFKIQKAKRLLFACVPPTHSATWAVFFLARGPTAKAPFQIVLEAKG